ncbi:hypothetical protein BST61_g11450 [Cercospora zeina]
MEPKVTMVADIFDLDETLTLSKEVLVYKTRESFVKKIFAECGIPPRDRDTESKACQRVYRRHQNRRKAVYKIMMAEIRRMYRKQQSTMGIASQLERPHVKRDETTLSKVQPYVQLSGEKNRAVKALFTCATPGPIDECR